MLGVEELKTQALYRALAAECLGTLVLVMMACGVGYQASDVGVALTCGITLATLILSLGHVSGGHFNPAVTLGLTMSRCTSIVRAMLYVASQVVGGIAGAGILYSIMPDEFRSDMGVLKINAAMTEEQAFGMEFMFTFIFVFTIVSATDERRTDVKGALPLAIGLVLTSNISFGMHLSGACMNPARAIAPAIIVGGTSAWAGHWVYWLGPLAGGAVASVVHTILFRKKKDIVRMAVNGHNPLTSSQQHIIVQPDRF